MCSGDFDNSGWQFQYGGSIDEASLTTVSRDWNLRGLIGARVAWERDERGSIVQITLPGFPRLSDYIRDLVGRIVELELVIPDVERKEKSNFVFAFEELENNLHPALLRRLFRYVEQYAVEEQATIFLTTHSSTALDFFGTSEHAQIIRVSHDGESARANPVSKHFDRLGVVSELGARPSDLLQANGIVRVEGPSDRVYFNRWIETLLGWPAAGRSGLPVRILRRRAAGSGTVHAARRDR